VLNAMRAPLHMAYDGAGNSNTESGAAVSEPVPPFASADSVRCAYCTFDIQYVAFVSTRVEPSHLLHRGIFSPQQQHGFRLESPQHFFIPK